MRGQVTVLQLNVWRESATGRWGWELENRTDERTIGRGMFDGSEHWERTRAVATTLTRLQFDCEPKLIKWQSETYAYMRWRLVQHTPDYEEPPLL